MKGALELIFVGFIIVLFLFNLYGNLALTRLSKDTRLEIKSNTERLEYYKYSKQIIKKHWLFGVGIGNYTLYNANLRIKCESTNCEYANRPSWYYQPVHNTFLLVWAETGILGLVGFLGLLGYIIIFNFQFSIFKHFFNYKEIRNQKSEIRNSEQDYSNQGINKNFVLSLPILSAIIVIMLVDHWWWSLHFGMLFLWLILGLIVLDFSDKECYNNQAMPNKNNQ